MKLQPYQPSNQLYTLVRKHLSDQHVVQLDDQAYVWIWNQVSSQLRDHLSYQLSDILWLELRLLSTSLDEQ